MWQTTHDFFKIAERLYPVTVLTARMFKRETSSMLGMGRTVTRADAGERAIYAEPSDSRGV